MNELKEQILGAIKDLCPDKSAQGSRDYIEFLIDQYTTRKELEARLDELRMITQVNYADVFKTYDYDGIAETVIERIGELQTQLSTELKTNKEIK